MSNHLIIVLILLSIGFVQTDSLANTIVYENKIDVTQKDSDNSLVEAVESQLLSHVWEVEQRTLLFNEQGIVSEIINAEHACMKWWEVYAEDGQAYLKLISASEEVLYRVGVNTGDWTSVAVDRPVSVKATSIKNASVMTAAMRNLVGTWSSTIYPSDLLEDLTSESGKSVLSADFRYKVRSDGTFQKLIHLNGEAYQRTEGVWQLSADGSYFILHFDNEDGSFKTYIVKVKHLSLDELVIDQALVTSDVESKICGEMETFFFNKR